MATQTVSVPKNRWIRIIPAAFLMYTIAFMDRVNVGFGIPGIEKSLGVDATIIVILSISLVLAGLMTLAFRHGSYRQSMATVPMWQRAAQH